LLSASVVWEDIDAAQWANLWRFIHSPGRTPTRAIGLLEAGVPVALVSGASGQVPLDIWPYDEPSLDAVANRLRKELRVDQVILVESSVLSALWDEQQRFLNSEDDYDDYLFAIRFLTDRMLAEQAVCAPAPTIKGFPAIPFEQFRAYIAESVGPEGSFLITVFDRDALWWSVAGRVVDGSIVRLTSSQGLFPPDAPPPHAPWHQANAALVQACETTLGPVHLALSFQLAAFEAVLRGSDLSRAIARFTRTDDLIIWRQ
jgi:hypothetical protein